MAMLPLWVCCFALIYYTYLRLLQCSWTVLPNNWIIMPDGMKGLKGIPERKVLLIRKPGKAPINEVYAEFIPMTLYVRWKIEKCEIPQLNQLPSRISYGLQKWKKESVGTYETVSPACVTLEENVCTRVRHNLVRLVSRPNHHLITQPDRKLK